MRRILCVVLALILVISMVVVPCLATSGTSDYQSSSVTWWDGLMHYYKQNWDYNPIWELYGALTDSVCSLSEDSYHHSDSIYGCELGTDKNGLYALATCKYCGHEYKYYSADLARQYDNYVNDLPPGLTSSNTGTTSFGTIGVAFADTAEGKVLSDEFWASVDLYNAAASADIGQGLLVSYFSSSNTYLSLYKVHNTSFGFDMLMLYNDSSLSPYTTADFPLGAFCSFGSNAPSSSSSSICYYSSSNKFVNSVFLNYSDAASAYAASPQDVFYLRSDTRIVPVLMTYSSSSVLAFDWQNLGCISASGTVSVYSGHCLYKVFTTSRNRYVYPSYPAVVDVGDSYDSTTRVSNVTNIFNEYNTTNNYVDNSVVNYYIGTVDASNNVTNIYNTNIYNEDTLVFTEPVTGAQIQTTGWSYDYDTRSYDIKLTAGSFTMSDTDVTRIVATYGDEVLTLTYYDASNTALATDEYAYVLVASEGCTLYGHSYTYETIKEATCTHAGERKYTCSVCGDEYAEDIPMSEHTSTFSIFKEPTCTASGVGLYSCSTCGTEYTETIDALGHDWLEQETIDTTYTIPEGTSCPDCAGTDFSSELDEIAGIYVCACSGCGTEWEVDAVINYGETHYICSVCGATRTESLDPDNGLFTAIGDLLADAVTWVTDKLSQLVDSLSGLNDTFQDYMEQIKGSGGEYPAFLAAFVALLPEDLMAVLWFALIAVLVLAVWKKWFS